MKFKNMIALLSLLAVAIVLSCGGGGGEGAPPASPLENEEPIKSVGFLAHSHSGIWRTEVITIDEPTGKVIMAETGIEANLTVSDTDKGKTYVVAWSDGGESIEVSAVRKSDRWLSGFYTLNGVQSGDVRIDLLGIEDIGATPYCNNKSDMTLYSEVADTWEGIRSFLKPDSSNLIAIATDTGKTLKGFVNGTDAYFSYIFDDGINQPLVVTLTGTLTQVPTCLMEGQWSSAILSDNTLPSSGDFTMGSSMPVSAGDIIATELMINPDVVADAEGEWIELYNVGGNNGWNLLGCVLTDDGVDRHIITEDITIFPGEYATLAISSNPGFTPDYVYSNFFLGNSGDEVVLECRSEEIDRVAYDAAVVVADKTGSLDPSAVDAISNDNPANWCLSDGTPGAVNINCAPPTECVPGTIETIQCGTSNVGICQLGTATRTCGTDGFWGPYGICVGAIEPRTEVCNGVDDDCDGQTDEGAATDLCGTINHATPACVSGQCMINTCDLGWTDCNGAYADGCEVNLNTDPGNCGSCGNVCPSGWLCTAGRCENPIL